jgi:hypothetical protein
VTGSSKRLKYKKKEETAHNPTAHNQPGLNRNRKNRNQQLITSTLRTERGTRQDTKQGQLVGDNEHATA